LRKGCLLQMKIGLLLNKSHIASLRIADYDYHLPQERVARYPLVQRDMSKLLIYRDGNISERKFNNLPEILSPNDLLVFNNTRVIPARLKFQKTTGANIEIFCLEPIMPSDYPLAFQSRRCIWKCIVGNAKKWKDDRLTKEIESNGGILLIHADKKEDHGTFQHIEFTWNDQSFSFSDIIELAGVTPIPPYLNRESEAIDRDRYQTVYSKIKGSVAAPTAGLHFTDRLLQQLTEKGISFEELTLHVGAGTFKPVQSETIGMHEMHTEFFQTSAGALKNLMANEGRIVSVGTTTLRTLESLYWLGVKLKKSKLDTGFTFHLNQWDAYELEGKLTYSEAIEELLVYLDKNNLNDLYAYTQIMIAPGYRIRSIKALITNFHQPKSTLLLLVSAIAGNDWKKIYNYALEHEFRFLSYGDGSILFL
jgi:S-adenosylmethionine:tRNA ribosyltransferase-isomerase